MMSPTGIKVLDKFVGMAKMQNQYVVYLNNGALHEIRTERHY